MMCDKISSKNVQIKALKSNGQFVKKSIIAENLFALLKHNHLNASRLAQYLNLPVMTIRKLILGEIDNPRVSTLKKIADYLKVSIDLFVEENQKNTIVAFKKNKLCLKRRFNIDVNNLGYKETSSQYVFYKIIGLSESIHDEYLIQCINTKTMFEANISKIVMDAKILFGLHPLQSCIIGVEYAKYIKNNTINPSARIIKNMAVNEQEEYEYGLLKILYQDRKGNICFINSSTSEQHIMSPKDIVLSDNIIGQFNSEQAFFLGMSFGK
jgi:transcriptional regulator with XRE-family HTH domain